MTTTPVDAAAKSDAAAAAKPAEIVTSYADEIWKQITLESVMKKREKKLEDAQKKIEEEQKKAADVERIKIERVLQKYRKELNDAVYGIQKLIETHLIDNPNAEYIPIKELTSNDDEFHNKAILQMEKEFLEKLTSSGFKTKSIVTPVAVATPAATAAATAATYASVASAATPAAAVTTAATPAAAAASAKDETKVTIKICIQNVHYKAPEQAPARGWFW